MVALTDQPDEHSEIDEGLLESHIEECEVQEPYQQEDEERQCQFITIMHMMQEMD